MDEFEELLRKSLECESDSDEGIAHFSRRTISLAKFFYPRRGKCLSYSEIERLFWDRHQWEKKYLRDENEK